MLVDDDSHLLRTLSRCLHKQPYRLFTARDAIEAQWVLQTQSVDLVVSDERMPGRSGMDLLSWIAEKCPEVVRIMLTGQADVDTVAAAINRGGVFKFLTKPCREFELAMAIRDGLDRSRG